MTFRENESLKFCFWDVLDYSYAMALLLSSFQSKTETKIKFSHLS